MDNGYHSPRLRRRYSPFKSQDGEEKEQKPFWERKERIRSMVLSWECCGQLVNVVRSSNSWDCR